MKTKKILALLLTIVMLTGLMPQAVLADTTVNIDLSTVSGNGTGYTCSALTVNGKTEYVVTITDSGSYTLTGTVDQPKNPIHPTHVVVSAATADIILNGVSVSLYNFSPLSINPGSTVNLILADGTTNTLTTAASTIATAGLYVPAGAAVIIGGTGTLNAAGCYDGGAGIGGGKGNGIANAGNITINSGIINAAGGWEGAGIGGGDNGGGGTITINGGIVNATGGDDGAGIGGGREGAGGSISISGGTVTAIGKEYLGIGRGIGNYSSSPIKFTGGSIRTNYVTTQPSNGTSPVYFTTVTVIDNSGNALEDTNISCTMPSGVTFDSVTDGAGKLYLWLPVGSNTTVALISGGVDYKATGNITAGTNNLTAAPITVTGVTVSPSAAQVQKGNTQTFSAAVTGTNNPAQTVTWSVYGNNSGDTNIDNTGLLIVAVNETASTLTVTATSTVDNTKSGTAAVTVTEVLPPVPVVDSVTVTPATAVIQKGNIQTFSAAVTGANNPVQTVTWSVYGNSSSGTSIDNAGLLTVAVDEMASTLIVTATSAVDDTKSGTATVTVTETPPPAPVVTGVIITPATAVVQKGNTQTFSAAVTGANNPAQTVTWSVSGNTSAGTDINSSGLLTVGADETAATITVKAVSTADNTKFGTATVTVTNTPLPPATVSSVTVSPSNGSVQAGETKTFMATVTGTNNPPQDVTWSVSGNSSIGTTISSTGVLTVGEDETAASLTVTATSAFDNTKYGTATVTVTVTETPPPVPTVTAVTVTPATAAVQKGNTKTFSASVTGTNNPSQDVTWRVDGKLSSNTAISSGGVLTVGSDETASTLTITATSTLDSTKYGTATVTVTHTGSNTPGSGGGNGSGGGDSAGSGGSNIATVNPTSYNASISGTDASGNAVPKTVLNITINQNTASASVKIGSAQGANITAGGKVVIAIPSIPNVTAYTIELPAESLSNTQGSLILQTDAGSMVLPANMLANTGAAGKNAELSIAAGDKTALPEAAKAAIGSRPLIQLALKIDGKEVNWNNPNAPVEVSIPYTPSAEELANPESIVIWYIDGNGNAVSVPNGHYDVATGTVTFTTTHFSYYAVGYNRVSFNDVAARDWYSKAVGFIAAREITTGTRNGNYNPDAKLTRGEFIVMLLKAYDIAPETNRSDNFTDAGNTYYTGYLAAAKRLGISGGVGNNMFAPGKEITRQEMFTLLYNALKAIGRLPEGKAGKDLAAFSDAGDIASWAKDAMALFVKTGTAGGTGGRLSLSTTTTRAEMAQVLYNLLYEAKTVQK